MVAIRCQAVDVSRKTLMVAIRCQAVDVSRKTSTLWRAVATRHRRLDGIVRSLYGTKTDSSLAIYRLYSTA
jgi:hypothetical protein